MITYCPGLTVKRSLFVIYMGVCVRNIHTYTTYNIIYNTYMCDTHRSLIMKGRKISKAEFKRNYSNVKPSEINKSIKKDKDVQVDIIHDPVTINYYKIIAFTDKARLIQFLDGVTYWLPKKLSILDRENGTITIPKTFTNETALLDFEVGQKTKRKQVWLERRAAMNEIERERIKDLAEKFLKQRGGIIKGRRK